VVAPANASGAAGALHLTLAPRLSAVWGRVSVQAQAGWASAEVTIRYDILWTQWVLYMFSTRIRSVEWKASSLGRITHNFYDVLTVEIRPELIEGPSCDLGGFPMDMGTLARSMRARMPWPVGQRVLRQNELPRGHGWEKTVEKLSDERVNYDYAIEGTTNDLREHLLCGEKLVRLYMVSKPARNALTKTLQNVQLPKSRFREAYPALLSEDELEAGSSKPILISIEDSDEGVSAVFASVRSLLLKEPLTPDELPEGVADALSQYDEIVGIKYVRYEAVDVVSIPKTGDYVGIRVDFPNGMHRDVAEVAQSRLRTELSSLVKAEHLSSPVNLFPLIDAMYKAKTEGTVVELAFGTTTASLKHEKMRRRGTCLRDEAYHKGGKAALGSPIEPYRLSIVWRVPFSEGESTPELGLYSTALASGSANPILTDAVIRKCMGLRDFNYVEKRIEYFLSRV